MRNFNLERDLVNNNTVRQLVQTDEVFAQELYAALCNMQFIHTDMNSPNEEYWACSWRASGDIVAGIDATGGSYMDYYCSGNEGHITERIQTILRDMGWSGRPWPKES